MEAIMSGNHGSVHNTTTTGHSPAPSNGHTSTHSTTHSPSTGNHPTSHSPPASPPVTPSHKPSPSPSVPASPKPTVLNPPHSSLSTPLNISVTGSSTPPLSVIPPASSNVTVLPLPTNAKIFTTTVIVTAVPTPELGTSNTSVDRTSGFFDNRGAVAGVFVVLGLAVAGILAFLVTLLVRRNRRRAREAQVIPRASLPDPGKFSNRSSMVSEPTWEDLRGSHGQYHQPPLEAMTQVASARPLAFDGQRLPAPFQDYFALSPDMPAGTNRAGPSPIQRNGSYRSQENPVNPFASPQDNMSRESSDSGHHSPFGAPDHSIIPGPPPPTRPPRSPSPGVSSPTDSVFNTTPTDLPRRPGEILRSDRPYRGKPSGSVLFGTRV